MKKKQNKSNRIRDVEHMNVVERMLYEDLKDKIIKIRCELCPTKKNLTIHHVEEVCKEPAKFFDVKNCRVLCRKCHDKIHTKKWKRKNEK